MIALNKLTEKILRDMNRENVTADKTYLEDIINMKYFEIAAEHPWQFMREPPLSIDLSSADYATGMWLPSNLLGIEMVRENDSDQEIVPRDFPSAYQNDEYMFKYFTYAPAHDDSLGANAVPLDRITDMSITSGTTAGTFATPTWQADWPGEYLQIEDEYGLYKLSAVTNTLTNTYYGPTKANVAARVRPEYTQKIVMLSPDETAVTDKTIRIYYWSMPVPLYNDDDPVMLPDWNYLMLSVLREMPEAKRRRPVSKDELDEARRFAMSRNPDFPRKDHPRNKHNSLFTHHGSPFGDRRNEPTTRFPNIATSSV
jgi:hypothetical protein